MTQNKKPAAAASPIASLIPAEADKFDRMAADWWDPHGPLRPLHQINPVRCQYIREQVVAHFNRSMETATPLEGLTLLDIGCGGGLLAEPMTRLGAAVTAIDPVAKNIAVAQNHAKASGLDIAYQATTAEEIAAQGQQFDIVTCLEVVEHVDNLPTFVATCAQLVKPGGLIVFSTLNRTLKSLLLAKIGAEYILRWLPRGTHQWEKFLKPSELMTLLSETDLYATNISGLEFAPLQRQWRLTTKPDVNYFITARRG